MSSWIENIDVNAYVQSLMQRETNQIDKVTKNQLSQLNNQQSALKTQISNYGQLQNLLNTFQQQITALTNAFNPSYSITSSNPNIASAVITAGDNVSPGSHNLTINKLAQASQTASSVFSSNSNSLNLTDTLTIGAGGNSFNVDVNSTDSLQTIADNINANATTNNVGVFASVISTGTNQYQLVVSSTQAGTANAASISETGPGALNISTVLTPAQDAQFTLDTLDYDLTTNSAQISGLNINLLSLGSTTFTINQTNSPATVNQTIQSTVAAYNNIMTTIAQMQADAGVPDPTLTLLQQTLQNSMSSNVLTNLGITPTPYNQVTPINATTADGSSVTVYPMGLLSIQNDPITGQTLLDKLNAGLSTIQSQLVGAGGVLTNVSNSLNASTGSVWRIFNDSTYGSLTKDNQQVSTIGDQILSIQNSASAQKKALVMKYAQLDLLLNNLQVKSQYLTQQLEVMNHNKNS